MIVDLKMDDCARWKMAVEAIKDLLTDANFDFTKDGVTLNAMDANHVSMVRMEMDPSMFQAYNVRRNITVGINVPTLAKVLACADKSDAFELAISEGDEDQLVLSFVSIERAKRYAIKLIDLDVEALGVPADIKYTCEVSMEANKFQGLVRELENLGMTTVTLSIDKHGDDVVLKSEGDKMSTRVVYRAAEFATREDDIELEFALRYLKFFCKATPMAERVVLHMSEDTPLMMEYDFIYFYLAPKIKVDEQE